MADGLTSLSVLNYGVSTGGAAGAGETTLTLGQDRKDVQNPPDVYHVWNQQISQMKNLLLLMTADTKGGTRLLVREQGSNPFGVNESGFYMDTSGNAYKVHNGTPTALTGGGGSTGNWTFSTDTQTDTNAGIIQALGLTLKSTVTANGTPVATDTTNAFTGGAAIFSIKNAGTTKAFVDSNGGILSANGFFDISAAGAMTVGTNNATSMQIGGSGFAPSIPGGITIAAAKSIASTAQGSTNTVGLTIAPNVADGASSVALVINSGTSLTSGKLLSIRNNGTERWSAYTDGTYDYMLNTSGNAGMQTDGTHLYFKVGTTSKVALYGAAGYQFTPVSDNDTTCGQSSTMWSQTYSYAYMTKAQANTMGATVTINPANGSLCKQTYTSATNVTSMTISAGVDGQEIMVMLIQPAAGTAATMATTWTNVSFAGGTGAFTATLGKRDVYWFTYDGSTSKWYESGRVLNLTN